MGVGVVKVLAGEVPRILKVQCTLSGTAAKKILIDSNGEGSWNPRCVKGEGTRGSAAKSVDYRRGRIRGEQRTVKNNTILSTLKTFTQLVYLLPVMG